MSEGKSSQERLFEDAEGPRAPVSRKERVRTREPVREQGRMVFEFPEDTLASDHPARLLWRVVERMDLSAFLAGSRAVEGHQGRDRLSVHMLLSLWLYAVSVGVGSAREIARRIDSDPAFRWLVGDERVGHAKLSEFLVGRRDALEKAFSDVLGLLMHRGLLQLDLVAQDGTRVRANACASSFRREGKLEECREHARLHMQAVLSEADDPSISKRLKRLREAKAREYEERVEDAISSLREQREAKKANAHRKVDPDKQRASTTDPDARRMKMGDGGFRPAYNVQLATAGSPLGGKSTVVGLRVTNVGSDLGSVGPILDEVKRGTGSLPKTLLADGNHADLDSIRAAHERGVTAIIPPRSETPGSRSAADPPILEWRARVQTEEAKELYRARSALAELPNARLKTRFAMSQLLVRGLDKVTCFALVAVLSMNILTHASQLA
jgi:transposase